MWEELAECLKNLADYEYDLYVTIVKEDNGLVARIRDFKANASIQIVPNKGYDVGPFFHVLNQVNLKDYDYLIKLHSKRDLPGFFAKGDVPFGAFVGTYAVYKEKWREYLLSFIKSRENFERCLKAFNDNAKLGMISNFRLILDKKEKDQKAYKLAQNFLQSKGFELHDFKFVAGTMFIAKSEIFELAKSQFELDINSFDETKRKEDRTLAHILERAMGGVVYAKNYLIDDPLPQSYLLRYWHLPLSFWGYKLFRFFFQMRYTNRSGKLLIKVFRIPVFRKKMNNQEV